MPARKSIMSAMRTRVLFCLLLAATAIPLGCGEKNRAPDQPEVVDRPAHPLADSTNTFSTTVNDPDGDSVQVRFDWGDSTLSPWSDWAGSGDTIALTHAWSDTGAYVVRAWAQDRKLLVSDTADGIALRVVLSWPPDTLRLWRVQLGAGKPLASSPAIAADGTIYVGSPDSGLYAVSPEGVVEWHCQTDGALSSPAVASDGTIYVGSSDSSLYAINPDGTQRWRHRTGAGLGSSPSIAADGTIYVGCHDNKLYALAPDGSEKWTFLTEGSLSLSAALAADGTVYICSHDGYLYAVNPDGTLKWRWCYTELPMFTDQTPAIGADGTIYCGAAWPEFLPDYCALCALNPDGSLKWARTVVNDVSASPAVGPSGTIYVSTNMSKLYAFNPDSTLKWAFPTQGGIFGSSPTLSSDGTIYFGTAVCYYALNRNGTVKWDYGSATGSSPCIALDGTVYFVSTDGHLYAFRGTSPLADAPWPKFQHDNRNTGRVGGGR
jgi:outer membrane protein assembly factor BamB